MTQETFSDATKPARRLIRARRLFTGSVMLDDAFLLVEGEQVVTVSERIPDGVWDEETDLGELTVLPGLVDLQVNGGGGVMLNDAPTLDGVRTIREAHRDYGTTSVAPTFVSGDTDGMVAAVRAVAEYARTGPADGVPAVHFEGPFLSQIKRGAHDPTLVRPPTSEDCDLIAGLAATHPLAVTVAPEVVGSALIKDWVAAGVRVWLGHSGCDAETAVAAADAGASGATHLFNAMSNITARDPGLTGAVFADDRLTAGLIMDGAHVHPIAARAAHAALGDRLFLVSDCLAAAAGGPASFTLGDRTMEVVDGACRTRDGALAGAALTLLECVATAVRQNVMPFEAAVRAATVIPARVIGNDRIGRLEAGSSANFIAVDEDLGLAAVHADGQWVRRLDR